MLRPDSIEIRRTDDVDGVRALGLECGLEDSGCEDDVLAAWGAYDGDHLVGGFTLERHADLYVPNWLAVSEGHRRRGIAEELYVALENDARARGARRLWVTARAPSFFLAQGFTEAEPGDAWDLIMGGCQSCPQYERDCHPRALTKPIDDDPRGRGAGGPRGSTDAAVPD